MLPQRKPMRLKGWNYSTASTYFLTVCTKNRQPLLCRIHGFEDDGHPHRTMAPAGTCVETFLRDIPKHYDTVFLDHFVVMPNHIHILVTIDGENGAPRSSRPTEIVPRIVALLKRTTNRACNDDLWQAGYMDHVIRNRADYEKHWEYIEHNPFRWAEDQYHI